MSYTLDPKPQCVETTLFLGITVMNGQDIFQLFESEETGGFRDTYCLDVFFRRMIEVSFFYSASCSFLLRNPSLTGRVCGQIVFICACPFRSQR